MNVTKKLSEQIEIIPRKIIRDSRGWFLKAITGTEKGLPIKTGEIYVVSSENGSYRGGHYHKRATEWFTLLMGEAILKLKDISTGELISIHLSSTKPETVVVHPFIYHRFESIESNQFVLLAYTNMTYDPADTIQYEI